MSTEKAFLKLLKQVERREAAKAGKRPVGRPANPYRVDKPVPYEKRRETTHLVTYVPFPMKCMYCLHDLTAYAIRKMAAACRAKKITSETVQCTRCKEIGYIDLDLVLIADEFIAIREIDLMNLPETQPLTQSNRFKGRPRVKRTCPSCKMEFTSVRLWKAHIRYDYCHTTKQPVSIPKDSVKTRRYKCRKCDTTNNIRWCNICWSDKYMQRDNPIVDPTLRIIREGEV